MQMDGGPMNTFETMDRTATDHLAETVRSDRDGAAPAGFAFAASALPVFGASGIKPKGIALSFAADEAESCGEDRFALCLVDAAGAVLASLADTLMPEAYEKGGPLVALSTTAGFVLSFVLATL